MFNQKEKSGIKYFISDLIKTPHVCTMKGWDMKNESERKVVCEKLNFDLEKLIMPIQEHTDNIVVISQKQDMEKDLSATDGIIITLKNAPVLIVCADCVPVLLYSKDKNILALLHAGWRGTSKGIVSKAVSIMKENFRVNPTELKGLIGACIGQCCYEVSNDVADKLEKSLQKKYDDILLGNKVNLQKINYYQLCEAGMVDIDVMDYCTSCDNDLFYSYRKNLKTPKRHGIIASL